MNPTSVEERERQLTNHLQRAGELLRGESLTEAEREVAKALELRADDARAQNLLGLLHFRAGRFAEALELYRRLVALDPEDPALRLNLGLVELRMGQHGEAVASLRRVVEKEPRNRKARGFLAMALLRAGDLVEARQAFLEAGQDDLARQVEERLMAAPQNGDAGGVTSRPLSIQSSVSGTIQARARTPSVDDDDAELTDEQAASLPVPPGERRTTPPPAPPPHKPPPEPLLVTAHVEPLRFEKAVTVSEFALRRLVQRGAPHEPFAITEGGMLVLRVDGRLPTRTSGAIMSEGQLSFEPLHRRERGRNTEETFGEGVEALSVASGKGIILVASGGARFSALSLQNDILYLRESAVYAFEETLHWENGRVPGGGAEGFNVVQFRGNGRCVVRAARPLVCVKLEQGDLMYVDRGVLLGWIGRVVPMQQHNADGEPPPYLECSGEGALILEEPPAPPPT